MNTDTGMIYEGEAQIRAAERRGEPLIYLSRSVQRDLERRPIFPTHKKKPNHRRIGKPGKRGAGVSR